MSETATLVLSNGTNETDLLTFGSDGEPCPEQTSLVVGLHLQRAIGGKGSVHIKTDVGRTWLAYSDGVLAAAYARLLIDTEKWMISKNEPSKVITAVQHLDGITDPSIERHLLELVSYAVETRQETYARACDRLATLHTVVADAATMATDWLREQEAEVATFSDVQIEEWTDERGHRWRTAQYDSIAVTVELSMPPELCLCEVEWDRTIELPQDEASLLIIFEAVKDQLRWLKEQEGGGSGDVQ